MVSAPWLTTLCYHRTAEHATSGDFDREIIDATPAQFEQQVKFLADHFTFVDVDQVVAYASGKGKLPQNPVLVTFDDGYKECFSLSLPILKRYGARATFFIATQQMTERRMFWWDRFAWILKNTKRDVIQLSFPRALAMPVATEHDRALAQKTLTELVKHERGLDLERFLGELDKAAGTSLSSADEKRMVDRGLMTWAEVEHLANAGMSIGSHCFSHRVLQTLKPSEYDLELGGSRRELEERLGRPVQTVAYPVGYPLGNDEGLRRAVRDAGYVLGFTVRAGVLSNKNMDPLDVPRILMDTSYDLQHFSAMTTIPGLAPRSAAGTVHVHRR